MTEREEGDTLARIIRTNLPAILVLIAGIILSAAAFVASQSIEDERRFFAFEQIAEQHQVIIRQRIAQTTEAVRSIAGLYAASDTVSRKEFGAFAAFELEDQTDIQALEWIPRVKHADRQAYEASAKKDGLSDFRFTQRQKHGEMIAAEMRDEYFPVYFAEPLKGNEKAVGFDLASNPIRKIALDRARDSGRLQATARVTLVQETGKQFGFLLFQPIYLGGKVPPSVEERREKLLGFALGVLRIGSMARSGISNKNTSGPVMEAFLFDRSAPRGEQLLYPAQSEFQSRGELTGRQCVDTAFDVGGRNWLISHCGVAGDDAGFGTQSWLVLFFGLLITGIIAAYFRTLTRQKLVAERMNRELAASQTLYSDIVDNTTFLIQSVDSKSGLYEFTNDGWLKALGYGRNEALGLQFIDVIHPDELTHCKRILNKAITNGTTEQLLTRFVARDGTTLLVEGSIVCRKDKDGRMVSHGVFTDITERQRSDDKIKEIANELTTLIDTANAPIFGIDTKGMINEWNQAAERITGYSKDEALNRNLVDEFITDEFKKSVKNVLDSALRGVETSNYEFPLTTKSGKQVDILLNSNPRLDTSGNIVGVVGVGQDITERKRIDAEREHLVRAVENLNECLALFDDEDRLVYCNEAYRVFNEGLGSATVLGTPFEDSLRAGALGGFVPDAIGREEEWVAERIEQHLNPTSPIEVRRHDGRTVLINEQNLNDGGRVLIMSDITELKQSQSQIIQSAKLATLGEMATSVTHELNQPLNVIRMGTGNVLRKIERGNLDADYLKNKMDRIAAQTERAAAIIDHMRMFGRKADEAPAVIDPADAVRGALDLIGEQLRLAEIDVLTELPEQSSSVHGHRIQLEQVILNLLTNARDAVEANGGEKTIKLCVESADDIVRITTEDSGGGIPQNIIGRIFEPFYTTKEMGHGTGLGLSVSYGIIRDMGGEISAVNTDKGARIIITLPVAEDSKAAE